MGLLTSVSTSDRPYIQTIEWDMMNKAKFIPLSLLSSFSIRCILYPFTVIKTRIQVQKHSEVYAGTFDAFRKICKYEGFGGLYKGFWVSSFQVLSGISYVTTYENVRHILRVNNLIHDTQLRALIGGGCASLVSQTIIVPFDIISQHMMVLGQHQGKNVSCMNPLRIDYQGRTKLHIALTIIRKLYCNNGLPAFYKGFVASICSYVPNSALWWTFYHFYQERVSSVAPSGTSTLLLQALSAPLAGITAAFITNPLDITRARLQVQGYGGFFETACILWSEENLRIFKKGLSARLIQSVVFSFMVIVGYESVKRISISDELKTTVTW